MTEKEKRIIDEARSWQGTKWMHGVSLKGYRTDCVQFIISLTKTFGWLPREYQTIKYNRDWALHNSESILLQEIEKYCDKVNDDFRIGDILLFNFGRCAAHAGIYIGEGKMVHCHIRNGVDESSIEEYRDKFHSAWRVKDAP